MTKQKQDRLELIEMAGFAIKRLVGDVCPACKAGETFYCEVVEGVHVHAQSGECKASPILQLLTHIDDIRHQFANEFNEAELPRVHWQIGHVRGCACCGSVMKDGPAGACKCGRMVCAECWCGDACLVCYADPMADPDL